MTEQYMNLKEFRDSGYLMEANRLFFHPLGLALGVKFGDRRDTEGYDPEVDAPAILYIHDNRGDPEGYVFQSLNDEIDWQKHANVKSELEKRASYRETKFGWVTQPMGTFFLDD